MLGLFLLLKYHEVSLRHSPGINRAPGANLKAKGTAVTALQRPPLQWAAGSLHPCRCTHPSSPPPSPPSKVTMPESSRELDPAWCTAALRKGYRVAKKSLPGHQSEVKLLFYYYLLKKYLQVKVVWFFFFSSLLLGMVWFECHKFSAPVWSCSGAEQVGFGFSPNKLINELVTNRLQGHLTSVPLLSSLIIFQLLLQQQRSTKKRNGRVNEMRESQRLGLWLAQQSPACVPCSL